MRPLLRPIRHAVSQPVDDQVEHPADGVPPLGTAGQIPVAVDDPHHVFGVNVRGESAGLGAGVKEEAEGTGCCRPRYAKP